MPGARIASSRVTVGLSVLAPALVVATLSLLGDARLTFALYHGLICLGVPAADLLLARRLTLPAAAAALGLGAGGSDRPRPGGREPGLGAEWRLGLGLGAIFSLAILGFFAVLGHGLLDPAAVRDLLVGWQLGEVSLPALLGLLILANAVVEELFWRGYLFARWRRAAGPRAAIAATALCYASYHAVTTAALFGPLAAAPLTAVVLAAGLFWGWLRQRRGSLVAPIVSHLLADAALMAVYLAWVR